MTNSELVPSLMFTTLGAGVLVGVVALLWFLRKRSNRDAYKRGTGIDENAGGRAGRQP
jgi:hypothetical protein